jgi:hypothetical protein
LNLKYFGFCLVFILSFKTEIHQDSWVNLFDGTHLDNWRTYQCDCISQGWTIESGDLVRSGPARDLITKEKYQDFILELSWKISKGGNSGIILRANENHQYAFMSGIEMQIIDDQFHADGESPLTSAGAVYGLFPNNTEMISRDNHWYKVRIEAIGTNIKFYLEDILINDIRIGSPAWNEAIQRSKFSGLANYGLLSKGNIVLQDHGDKVSFRNIRILAL